MSAMMQLTKYSRGWRGAKYVKKQTNKKMRQKVRLSVEDAPIKRLTKGWV